jgi:hypothetical protein
MNVQKREGLVLAFEDVTILSPPIEYLDGSGNYILHCRIGRAPHGAATSPDFFSCPSSLARPTTYPRLSYGSSSLLQHRFKTEGR